MFKFQACNFSYFTSGFVITFASWGLTKYFLWSYNEVRVPGGPSVSSTDKIKEHNYIYRVIWGWNVHARKCKVKKI